MPFLSIIEKKNKWFQCPPVQIVENSGAYLLFLDVPYVPANTYFVKIILMFQEKEDWVESKKKA